ncbi:hypothetical protein [Bradyrhizobium sp.]|uniref:hypothetical protein n=1 Tax=Bradyrhizobium sp. TaxID=376 RepID=UPI00260CD814|nr:hypothetical protein [Bradyrhizobium sp.]
MLMDNTIQFTPSRAQMKERGNRYSAAASARRHALAGVNAAYHALEIAHYVAEASQNDEAMVAELEAEDAVMAAVEALTEAQTQYVEAFHNYVLAPGDAA